MVLQAYKSLGPKARLALGLGVVTWGAIGLYASDNVEEKFGFNPSKEEKAAVDRYIPKITVVDSTERK